MQIQVDGQRYQLDDDPLGRGGEGEVYPLDSKNVVKVYFDNLLDTPRRQKVLALCDSYANFCDSHDGYQIAFPSAPAYRGKVAFDGIVGFSMTRYEHPKLSELGFNLALHQFEQSGSIQFNDVAAIKFVYDLYDVLDKLHRTRIILGDINPDNIECESGSYAPIIIDIDAAQIGGFECASTHPDYNDPRVVPLTASNTARFTYDAGSDVFALGVVCFEFLVGARPHMLYVTPPKKDKENKALGISNVKTWADGRAHLAQVGLTYFDCEQNQAVEDRLRALHSLDGALIDFFYRVFVEGRRDSLLQMLPLNDPRHPAHHFLVESGFKSAIDEEARRRARARAAARQGFLGGNAPLPDSGFKQLIGALLGTPSAGEGTPPSPPPRDRSDPEAFLTFAKRFDLIAGDE